MKKLAITLFFLCLGMTQTQAQSVVVTEIYNDGITSNEWVELYVTSGPVDLRNWTLSDYTTTGAISGTLTFAIDLALSSVPTGTRIVISKVVSDTDNLTGSNWTLNTSGTYLTGTAFNISGTRDAVQLLNSSGTLIHALAFNTGSMPSGSALETLFNDPLTSNITAAPASGQSIYLISDNPLDSYIGIGTTTKGATNSLLPIELTTFQARAENEAVQLSWTTASESNNDRFEVQERVGDTWNKVSEVKGNGTSTVSNNYAVAMQNLEAGYHTFRLKQVDYDGKTSFSDEVQVLIELQDRFQLSEAYPNPFNPSTAFSLTVAKDQQVQVQVYDMTGRLVSTLFNGQMKANEINRFSFDAQNLASGVYFYRTVGESFTMTKKMLLMK